MSQCWFISRAGKYTFIRSVDSFSETLSRVGEKKYIVKEYILIYLFELGISPDMTSTVGDIQDKIKANLFVSIRRKKEKEKAETRSLDGGEPKKKSGDDSNYFTLRRQRRVSASEGREKSVALKPIFF